MDHSSGSHHSDMCLAVAVSFYYSARLTGHRGCLGEFAFFQLLTHTSGQEHFLFRLVNHEIFDCFFCLEFLVQHLILAAFSDSLWFSVENGIFWCFGDFCCFLVEHWGFFLGMTITFYATHAIVFVSCLRQVTSLSIFQWRLSIIFLYSSYLGRSSIRK